MLSDPGARAATAATSLERHEDFTIGIVEFDDQGRFWDRRQVDALEAEILRNAGGPDDPGVILPVFVHGWRHNADVCDANLACFRELARRVVEDHRTAIALTSMATRPRPVVAVFVGWRGLSKKVWPFEQLSFVARKDAALRVGGGDMVELLTRLDRIRQELNAVKKDASRLIVIGHSLGATLVFEALANVFKNRLSEVWPGVDADGSSRVIRGFGDLVVLVNPAFEAERWRPIHDLASTYAGFSTSQRPVLVVVGSETDSTTAMWFPFEQWVGTLFKSTRDAEQRRALRTAIGNYEPFVTHRLARADLPSPESGPRASNARRRGCVCELPRAPFSVGEAREILGTAQIADVGRDSGREGESWGNTPCQKERVFGHLRLSCTGPGRRGNPFWVVRASSNVLDGHSGFFSPYFVEFVRGLVHETMSGTETPEEPGGGEGRSGR